MSRRKQSAAARESFWLMTACYGDPVQEVVHRMKRRKVRRWQPAAKSYAELVQILQSTVSAKDRERVQRKREEALADARNDSQAESA